MNCPQCGSEMWDNRETKKNPKGPDYKCKDKACAHAIWLNSKKSNGAKSAPAKATGPKWTWQQLRELQRQSLLIAKQTAALVPDATSTDIVSLGAWLFIAATRDGVEQPKKEEPAPAVARGDADEDDGVPF